MAKGLTVLDISDPASPKVVGSHGPWIAYEDDSYTCLADPPYVYVAGYNWGEAHVFDVSNPSRPFICFSSMAGFGMYNYRVCVRGSCVYHALLGGLAITRTIRAPQTPKGELRATYFYQEMQPQQGGSRVGSPPAGSPGPGNVRSRRPARRGRR